jgi:hypothetical protein
MYVERTIQVNLWNLKWLSMGITFY